MELTVEDYRRGLQAVGEIAVRALARCVREGVRFNGEDGGEMPAEDYAEGAAQLIGNVAMADTVGGCEGRVLAVAARTIPALVALRRETPPAPDMPCEGCGRVVPTRRYTSGKRLCLACICRPSEPEPKAADGPANRCARCVGRIEGEPALTLAGEPLCASCAALNCELCGAPPGNRRLLTLSGQITCARCALATVSEPEEDTPAAEMPEQEPAADGEPEAEPEAEPVEAIEDRAAFIKALDALKKKASAMLAGKRHPNGDSFWQPWFADLLGVDELDLPSSLTGLTDGQLRLVGAALEELVGNIKCGEFPRK